MTKATLVSLLMLYMFVMSCSQNNDGSSEAIKAVSEVVESDWIMCGDSHFQRTEYILEQKNVTWSTESDVLTAADRANGVEWKGKVFRMYGLERSHDGRRWREWVEGWGEFWPVVKKDGAWYFVNVMSGGEQQDLEIIGCRACRALSCGAIPSE